MISESLLRNVPKIVAEEFQRILNSSGNAELLEPVNMDEGKQQNATNAEEEENTYVATFEENRAEMVVTLANQLISCFDKQNDTIKQGLQGISESLLRNVLKIVAEEFQRILNSSGNYWNPLIRMKESNRMQRMQRKRRILMWQVALLKTASTSEELCAICLEEFTDPKKLKCEHRFCTVCIDAWLFNSGDCPVCRKPAKSKADDTDEYNDWSWSMIVP
ncbi:hypothetical protein TSAR_000023 [Trichomalopsis sarcophagae]|uniref:RING-type E3 ubiquitin transferase n=1 Tax=Trichomalopsis sarcophagae TaxID=543379 RepID=A0A232ESU1_9HYME|nr:hypothetical protein TSAR_000023 [Trichomalopsis sarcophagae]